jgi:hypothetical protein
MPARPEHSRASNHSWGTTSRSSGANSSGVMKVTVRWFAGVLTHKSLTICSVRPRCPLTHHGRPEDRFHPAISPAIRSGS